VDLILSALDAARARNEPVRAAEPAACAAARPAPGGAVADIDRRLIYRIPYHVRAHLRLFSDGAGEPPWTLYTRDVDPRGLGFITPHRLPLGYGGWVELFTPRGHKTRIQCTLLRCRQAVNGWFEGHLAFNRPQWQFEIE
jgi:hypothetical protein